MATIFKSDGITNAEMAIRVYNPSNTEAKPIRLYFRAVLPATGLGVGDSIRLCILHQNMRVLGGQFCWSVGQGATATTAIGRVTGGQAALPGGGGASSDPERYRAAAVTNSADVFRFADTQAQNFGDALPAVNNEYGPGRNVELVATNGAAAWTAGSVLAGYVDVST